ncbi:MAG: hypothetical protein ABFS86_10390 [Planctomycetota bacterium]
MASIVGLAMREMEAFWALSLGIGAIEGGVLLRRLTRPLRLPAFVERLLSRLAFLILLSLVVSTYRAVVEYCRSPNPFQDPLGIVMPVATGLVWFFVWRRTRPSVWDVKPVEADETPTAG